MTSAADNPTLAPPRDRAGVARRVTGILRLLAGGLVLAAIIEQIVDLLVNGEFEPQKYFTYFTIDSSMINVVVLVVGGVLALKWARDPELYTAVRMSAVAYAVVTAAVYNILLRNIPPTGFVGVQWPNEVEHVWIPLYIALDWLLAPGRARLSFRRLWLVVSFPVAWCAFTLIRGAITGFYPYPFIDPTGDGGYPSVIAYILGLSAFIILLATGIIAISRTRRSRI